MLFQRIFRRPNFRRKLATDYRGITEEKNVIGNLSQITDEKLVVENLVGNYQPVPEENVNVGNFRPISKATSIDEIAI